MGFGLDILGALEECFLPAPETIRWDKGQLRSETLTTAEKVGHYAKNFFLSIPLLVAAPFALGYQALFANGANPASKLQPLEQPFSLPLQRGFATSLFQTAGLGLRPEWSPAPQLEGRCDWDKWMENRAHIKCPEGFPYKNFFTDILSDPTAYIEMLKEHGATAHRFSLEWSVIEPRAGVYDEAAIALYRNFIDRLLGAGITPSVTLSHFVVPEWFYESGNFQNIDNVDLYVRFALKAMELFPKVNDWWSFNELGVKAFQQTREVYPTDLPEGSSLSDRVHAAGIATRNMLIAHCKLHQAVVEKYGEVKKVGVTHQWLKFDTASGNWLERLVAHFFTSFGFSPVYNFFKDGVYSMKIPFMANIRFVIPKQEFEQNGHFLQRLGVQAYPMPMLKMGLNHGKTYPGPAEGIKNFPFFSFGSTCEPDQAIMRFGPRWRAEAMQEILQDAHQLTDEVFITEWGSDAYVWKWGDERFNKDDQAQADYLQRLYEQIQTFYSRTGKQLKGIFLWSDLRRQMEWENGHECCLGVIEPVVDENSRLTGWRETPASAFIKQAFSEGARENAVPAA